MLIDDNRGTIVKFKLRNLQNIFNSIEFFDHIKHQNKHNSLIKPIKKNSNELNEISLEITNMRRALENEKGSCDYKAFESLQLKIITFINEKCEHKFWLQAAIQDMDDLLLILNEYPHALSKNNWGENILFRSLESGDFNAVIKNDDDLKKIIDFLEKNSKNNKRLKDLCQNKTLWLGRVYDIYKHFNGGIKCYEKPYETVNELLLDGVITPLTSNSCEKRDTFSSTSVPQLTQQNIKNKRHVFTLLDKAVSLCCQTFYQDWENSNKEKSTRKERLLDALEYAVTHTGLPEQVLFFAKGHCSFLDGKYSEACDLFAKALASSQYHVNTWSWKDDIFPAIQTDLSDFISSANLSQKNNNSAEKLQELGEIFLKFIDKVLAEESSTQKNKNNGNAAIKIKIHGNPCDLCRAATAILLKLGKYEEAMSYWKRALQNEPLTQPPYPAWVILVVDQIHKEKSGDLLEILLAMNKLFNNDQKNVEYLFCKGQILEHLCFYTQARNCYQQVITICREKKISSNHWVSQSTFQMKRVNMKEQYEKTQDEKSKKIIVDKFWQELQKSYENTEKNTPSFNK